MLESIPVHLGTTIVPGKILVQEGSITGPGVLVQEGSITGPGVLVSTNGTGPGVFVQFDGDDSSEKTNFPLGASLINVPANSGVGFLLGALGT
jgi:hypothetical protein